jgi:hypothetical protein
MFCANESVSRGRTSAAEKPNERIYLNLVQVRNSLRRDRVTMVQAAESGRGVNLVSKCSTDRGWPTRWRVFREPQVRSVFVVVAHILGHQSFQMPLVQDDDVVQQFPPATSHPTFRHSVLPWTAKGSAHGLATHALHRRHYFLTKF